MGIFAKGSQFPANVEADTPQNRYGGQLTKDSVAGDSLGGVIGEVNSTASSANTTTGEIIKDIEALEGRVDALEGAQVKPHTHMSADIADKATYAEAGAPAGRVVQTGSDGFIHSRTNPTSPHHLTRKGYVDEAVTTASNTLNTRIGAVEEVTSTSGTGWSAYKRAGVVTLTLMGVTSGFTLPTGWRPPLAVYSPMAPVRPGTDGYFTISTGGVVSLYDATDSVYGTVTYITA